LDPLGGGHHLLAVGDGHEAGRLQHEPARALDVHQAHAAHPDRLHPRVPAEARDVDAGPLGGGDDHLARLGLDGAAVDRDGHGLPLLLGLRLTHLKGQPPSLMWTRNSSRNMRTAEVIDEGMDGPSTQIVVCLGGQDKPGAMLSHTSNSRSRSSSRPAPSSMRYMTLSSQPAPSRHGVHWPHDSWWKKRVMRQAARTAQVVSSMTTIDPEPSMDPALPTSSWSRGMSILSGPNHGADAPPGMNAFS